MAENNFKELNKLSPEERIEKLEELAKKRKKDLEQELKNIEELKNKSISEAIEDAKIEEEKEIEELRHEEKEEKKEKEKLEEKLAQEKIPKNKNVSGQINYDVIEKIISEQKPTFYEITKPEVYKTVANLYEKSQTQNLSQEEQKFISQVNQNVEGFMQNEIYQKQDKENKNYLSRTKTFLDKLLGV